MQGAEGTLYDGELFQLQFKFGSSYPFESPEVNVSINICVVYNEFNMSRFKLGYICGSKHSSSPTCI